MFTFQEDNQLSAWWDLTVLESPTSNTELESPGWGKLKASVESVNAPFLKMEIERKMSGELISKGIENPSEITLVLRESTSFSTFKFFQSWFDKFYDSKKRVFKTFKDETEYNLSLYKLKLTYYKGPLFNVGINLLNVNILGELGYDPMTPTYSFYLNACRIVGIQELSATYDSGTALQYSITILPEEVEFKQE